MVSLFQFLLFCSSEWQKISAEFTLARLALHRKCTPRKVDSTEAIVHMRTMDFAFSAASAEFIWPFHSDNIFVRPLFRYFVIMIIFTHISLVALLFRYGDFAGPVLNHQQHQCEDRGRRIC